MTRDEPTRPDPDALLAAAKRLTRGRLKVYLGMAPGVGKTFEMLSTGRRRRDAGVDVVVGVVETHGRLETEALCDGLSVMPRRPIDYRGRTLLEFDLDGALARRPALLLVDEYAHTNAPGSRHPKRWQDVEELLAAGIDVATTLNVQHLESLVDVIWKITGVRVRETVPDSTLSGADEIELVDITPEELLERLHGGKVYVPETAQRASTNFFKLENLTALREMALRRAAQTVDDQMVGAMRRQGIEGPWAAGERILVLIAGDGAASPLVRAGRRLADSMSAPWTVAHVERPNRPARDPHSGRRIGEAVKLAEQLGASTVVLTGDDLPGAVSAFARRNNVTQIVVGKSRVTLWQVLTGRSLAHALLRRTAGAALHFVGEGAPDAEKTDSSAASSSRDRQPRRDYALALAMVGAATALAFLIDRFSTGGDLAMIFLGSVLISGLSFGFRPALIASAAAILSYNYFFLEPRFSLAIGHPADLLTFVIFVAVAAATGWLTGRVRDQARLSTRRAAAVSALLAASRRLSGATDRDDAAVALAEQSAAAADGRAVVLLPRGEDLIQVAAAPAATTLTTGDMAAARWAWEKGEAAGAGTGTLPQISWTFRPLEGAGARAGVAGIEAGSIGPEGERLVLALLSQGAVALERADLAAAAAENQALKRSDKLRAALLNSISHDLRTPLSTVIGSATTLIDYGANLSPAVAEDLMLSIREDAERLDRYVGDLLDMTRLEGGALLSRAEWTDVRDVLGAAMARVERRLEGRCLARDFPAELAVVRTDPGLLEQAIVNILENAIAYSPNGSTIDVAAYEDRNSVVLSIEDEGPGIPRGDTDRIFEKFRRLDEPSDRRGGERNKGAGLGLSIAKGFIEAMGGRIAAASPLVDGRGTRLLISLPKPRASDKFEPQSESTPEPSAGAEPAPS